MDLGIFDGIGGGCGGGGGGVSNNGCTDLALPIGLDDALNTVTSDRHLQEIEQRTDYESITPETEMY